MTVERIALDSKVGAQGLVRALASDEACPYLPRAGMAQQCSSATQAHSPNMYSTCILAFQPIGDSASCTELNNLKQYEVEQSLRMQGACREWADQWPIKHADYQQTPLVLWQSLSVEHVPWTIKGMTQRRV